MIRVFAFSHSLSRIISSVWEAPPFLCCIEHNFWLLNLFTWDKLGDIEFLAPFFLNHFLIDWFPDLFPGKLEWSYSLNHSTLPWTIHFGVFPPLIPLAHDWPTDTKKLSIDTQVIWSRLDSHCMHSHILWFLTHNPLI